MIFTPHRYQELGIEHIFRHPRSALWFPMGMGKTSACLYAIGCLNLVEPGPRLVLAPKRVAAHTWPGEVKKWSNISHLGLCAIAGDESERRSALRQHADVFTINYENLQWLVETIGKKKWPFTHIIADESTKLKNFRLRGGGRRARALSEVAFGRGVKRFTELTGTPSPNGLADLWGQLWFLDQGQRLGRTYGSFIGRWFRYVGETIESRRLVAEPFAQRQIEERLKDICLALKVEDWFDVGEPVVVDVPVELPPTAMRQYKEFEAEMFLEIEGHQVEAMNAAAKTIKCLQLANGAIYVDENGKWAGSHDAKLDALDDIAEEASGAPILVVYHFKSDLARLKKRFPQGKEFAGGPEIIDLWNRGEVPMLFIHPASAGHGLNLQDGGNIVVIFGHWWDLEQYQQVIERIGPVRQMQSGHPRPVYIYNIRAVGTIDSIVINRRASKRSVQDLLMESARRRT